MMDFNTGESSNPPHKAKRTRRSEHSASDSKQSPSPASLPKSADLLEILGDLWSVAYNNGTAHHVPRDTEAIISQSAAALQTVMLDVIGEDEPVLVDNVYDMGAVARNNLRTEQRAALSLKLQRSDMQDTEEMKQ